MSSKRSKVALRNFSNALPGRGDAPPSLLKRRRQRALANSVRFGIEPLEARVVLSTTIAPFDPGLTISNSYGPWSSLLGQLGIVSAAPPTVQIVDDGDAGFVATNTWGHSVEPNQYYGDDHSYARGGHGADYATYTFTGLVPGVYRVSATWKGDTNRATSAPYSVYDGATLLGTIRINQQLQPGSLTDAGFNFGDIGSTWNITGTTLVVKVSDDTDFYVDADAMRIERLGALPAPAPQVTVSLDGTTQSSGQSVIDFGGTHPGAPVTRTFSVKNIGQQDLHLGPIDTLPNGFSLVSNFGATTLAPGASTSFSVIINASALGTYNGTMSFHSDDPTQSIFSLQLTGDVTNAPAPVLAEFTDTPITDIFATATSMTVAPDGRIFVLQQNGTVQVIENGSLVAQPFMQLGVNNAGERGLLGMAFDPDFADNHYVYVYYTLPDSHNRISRYTAVGDTVDPGSEYDLIDFDPSGFVDLGGGLAFGADGKLYVGVGDNGTPANGQDMSVLFGKILRLNSDGSIPTDNPFYNTATGNNRAIFALGVRNPYNISVQPGTGRIFANDLADTGWEEINDIVAGGNYGWSTTEGPGANPGLIAPYYTYQQAGAAKGITGGAFYNPTTAQFPNAFINGYFFTDIGTGEISWLNLTDGSIKSFAIGLAQPSSLAIDPIDGSLLYLTKGALGDEAQVHRISFQADTAVPQIIVQPGNQTTSEGSSQTFTVVAKGKNLTYQWSRGTAEIPGATGPSITLNAIAPSDDGATFTVKVTGDNGNVTSDVATLTVTSNAFPVPTILTPALGASYVAGQSLSFSGDGVDREDGSLPDSAFTWKIDFYTQNGVFPLDTQTGVRSGTFQIPDHISNTSTNVFYRITLSVADSFGQVTSITRDIVPQTATIHLTANVPGVTLLLDNQPQSAPYATAGVTGVVRNLGAPDTVQVNGMVYVFSGWSDAGTQMHDVATPYADTTYTANYTIAPIQYVDDHNDGYTSVGNWGISFEPGKYYLNDHSYAIGGAGADQATYTFTGLIPGRYRISATWHGDTNRATNAPFTIKDGATTLGVVRINQQQQPLSLFDQGFGFADLGGPYNITSGTLTVMLSDDANQYVDADAVRIERIGDLATGPEITVTDGTTDVASGTSTVDFGNTLPGAALQRVITVSNVGNAPLTLGGFGVIPLGYSIASGFGKTTLQAGESTTFTLQLNSDSAGTFTGAINFTNNDSDEGNFTFNVTGKVVVTPTVQIVDDRNVGWTSQGNMGYSVEGGLYFGDDHSYANGGQGTDAAIYTFTGVAPGQYRISATWRGDTNRATNSPFAIFDGSTLIATVRMNQQQQPSSFFDQGFGWADLAGPYNVTSGTLVVKLYDDANGYIDADAVRIERVGNVVVGPEIQVLDGANDLSTGVSTVGFGASTPGAPIQKTFTVKNTGTANLNLGAIGAMPAGFSLVSGFGSTTLAPGASTSFVVQLNAAAVGTFGGTITFVNDDANENPFSINITGSVAVGSSIRIIDDNDPGFSKVGTWGTSTETGYYGNDHSYAQGGGGADVATYTFTGLAAGTYRVSATWRGDTNRNNNTPFTITDGTNVLGVVNVNQQQQPNSLTDQGSNWGDLGNFDVTGNTLVVSLKDTSAAFAYVDADAIRVERISDIGVAPPAPSILYVDDRGAGWSSQGNWGYSAASIYYNGGHSYAINGHGANIATYTFSGITAGIYRVSATWSGDANRASNSPFQVFDGSNLLSTVIVNQQQQPSGLVDKGLNWSDLGNFSINGTTLIVKLNDDANGYVDSDAIRIERIGDIISGPRADVLVNGVHLTSGVLDFGSTQPGIPVQKVVTVTNIGTTALNLGAIGALPTGFSLAAGFGKATLAPGESTTFTLQLNAGSAAMFNGQVSFSSNDVTSPTTTFTVTGTVAVVVTPTVQIIDDGNAGWTSVGNWGSSVETGRYVGDDHHYATGGAGADVGIYTFSGITPGIYRVSATWRGDTNRGINVPFSIYDGSSLLGTVRINQQEFPFSRVDGGFPYADLGTSWSVTGSTLVVKISDDIASGFYADADAIRIERIGNLIVGPEIQVLDGTTDIATPSSTVAFGSTIPGTAVTKTITVKNLGTADLTLGAIAALPAGFSLVSGFGSTTVAPGAATTFVIKLDGTTLGSYSGTLTFANNDADEGPFSFNLSGSVVPPPPAPVTPTGVTATPGNGQVTLSWGAVANATSYTVRYGTADGGPYANPIVVSSGVSTTIGGLTNGTNYYFVVSASGLGGPSADSTQAAAKPTPISVVDFSTGFSSAASQLTVNGAAGRIQGTDLLLTDGAMSEATSVYITNQQNITGFNTQFTFQLTGSWPLGEGFTFVIQRSGIHAMGKDGSGLGYGAYDTNPTSTGGIANSIAIKFDTLDTQGEGNNSTGLYANGAAPTNIGAINLGDSNFDLRSYTNINCTMTYDGQVLTVTLFDAYNNRTATQQYTVDIPSIIGGDQAWVGFTASDGHQSEVAAIHSWKFTSVPSVPHPPAAPTNLTVTPGNSQVALSWTGAFGANSYNVKYGTSPGVYSTTTNVSGTSYTVPGLTNGLTYYFAVSAINGVGEGGNSAEQTTAPFALPAPAAPAGLSASSDNAQVLLNWTAVSGASSYNVKYGTSNGGPYTQTLPLATTGTSFTVTGLTNETRYYFVVSANGLGGESLNSTQATAKPSATAAPLDFSSGFTGASNALTFNGPAHITGSDLMLTDGGQSETTSVWANAQQNISTFSTQFTLQLTGTWPLGDGMGFVIQRAGPNAIGGGGGGLGFGNNPVDATHPAPYGGIANSAGIKFDLYDNEGEGNNSTGLYLNGERPTSAHSINLGDSGFDLRSYTNILVTMTYDGNTLKVTMFDAVNNRTATQNYTVDLVSALGGSMAWVGFTSATGHLANVSVIHNWTFTGNS